MSQVILNLLKRLPFWVRKLVKKSIVVIEKERWVTNKRMDGNYEHETGEIILWDPDFKDKIGLFIILTHEIAHKIYQEIFDQKTRQKWLIICSKEPIEKSIRESYPSHIAPEEQFCWLISLGACLNFFSSEMKEKLKIKEQKILQTNPLGYQFAKSALKSSFLKAKRAKGQEVKGIFHWQVEALKEWLFSDPHIKTFKK